MLIRPIVKYESGGAAGTVDSPPAVTPPAATAPAPSPETVTPPRDEKGRFTKEAIRAAAGLAPESPETPTPHVPTPTPAAQAPVVEASTLEAELANLDKLGEPAAPTVVVSPSPAAAPQPQPQLAQPAATPELQQVQVWAQNPDVAKAAVESARNWVFLNQAAQRGDIKGILDMLEPTVQQALSEHLWTTNRDTWIQRYTDEQNGVKADPRVDMLQRQLDALIADRQQQQQQYQQTQTQQQQQRQQQEVVTKFNAYADQLVEAVGLKDSPYRSYLESAVRNKVFSDPQMAAQIQQGKFGAYHKVFRELYPNFRALLQNAQTPPPAAQQPASAQLMKAPSGAPSGSAPATNPNEGITEGRLTEGFWKKNSARLKQLIAS